MATRIDGLPRRGLVVGGGRCWDRTGSTAFERDWVRRQPPRQILCQYWIPFASVCPVSRVTSGHVDTDSFSPGDPAVWIGGVKVTQVDEISVNHPVLERFHMT